MSLEWEEDNVYPLEVDMGIRIDVVPEKEEVP